jgi:hypothetical protein
MISKLLRHKVVVSIILVVAIILVAIATVQVRKLNKAHSTFDNYYAFRGCTELIKRTPTYGVCKTGSGKIITIVLYHGKWYLRGDLPIGILGHLS